ncbi:HD domain-containing protein [Amycolatopsis acidiphila]|uniref:HD domain-containing protein n=1 Tax=Amycolatopsis acidiphila TaxID=715473 RepID=A0A558A4K5_9PSEU|nr:HD domain-containing protein [Amycolatopsis acidiphila]TVT19187.1 HD domain-containing protein [Amycolatopsis acidiphila]UIJ62003.1 HD domain-containing protein [Amycolatopsis acidiphila]GHG56686.1 phosphohydrolase [Amycolatopsis acidiphila]
MTTVIAGITIPDSALVAEATELVRDATPDLLFHHSRRVFLFGSLQGRRLGLRADPELLYVGAMFHDLGLTEKYRGETQRFELDGADEARRFLESHGVPEAEVRKVWEGIALHTTPEVPWRLEPEVALVTAGVETDVPGIGRDLLSEADLAAVVAAHPRPDFKRQIIAAFADGFRHRPDSTFGTVNADVLEHDDAAFHHLDFVEVILGNSWPE